MFRDYVPNPSRGAPIPNKSVNDVDNCDYFFFSFSHGMAIGDSDRYFEIPVKNFSFINIYADHNESINLPYIPGYNTIINALGGVRQINPEYLKALVPRVKYVYKAEPITNKSGISKFYVPPLKFGSWLKDKETEDFNLVMGLWFYSRRSGTQFIKIHNIDYYIQLTAESNILGFTYNNFFNKIIPEAINKLKLDHRIDIPSNAKIGLGLFCCRQIISDYRSQYPTALFKSVEERNMYPLLKTSSTSDIQNNYFNSTKDPIIIYGGKTKIIDKTNINTYRDNKFVPLYINTLIRNEAKTIPGQSKLYNYASRLPWQPLGLLTTQGCGLNVLSFYQFMITTMAREKTFCLTNVGTSIFRLIDYLDFYLTNRGDEFSNVTPEHVLLAKKLGVDIDTFKHDMVEWMSIANPVIRNVSFPKETKYTVIRFSKDCLWDYLNQLKNYPINNSMVVVKLYVELMHKDEYNHVGHSISFYFEITEGVEYPNVYWVDPQNPNHLKMLENPLSKEILNKYLSEYHYKYKYFDTIWFNSEEMYERYIKNSLTHQLNDINIIETDTPGVPDVLITQVNDEGYEGPVTFCEIGGYIIPLNNIHHGGSNSSGDLRSQDKLVVQRLSAPLPLSEFSKKCKRKSNKTRYINRKKIVATHKKRSTRRKIRASYYKKLGGENSLHKFEPDFSQYSEEVIQQLQKQEEKNDLQRLLENIRPIDPDTQRATTPL